MSKPLCGRKPQQEKSHDGHEGVIKIPQPLGLYAGELFQRAAEYLAAFKQLDGCEPSYDYPKYFLAAHSLELTLKSYLAANEVCKEDLINRYSHSLGKLLSKCESLGLRCPAELRGYVGAMAAINCDHDFRYPSGFQIVAPPSVECVSVTEALQAMLKPIIARVHLDATLKFASDTRLLKGKKIAWSD
ncbi:MAG: hypothetical protein ABIL01_16950 [Pseudomonadota bacterium]